MGISRPCIKGTSPIVALIGRIFLGLALSRFRKISAAMM
jgi:hypothetical protein